MLRTFPRRTFSLLAAVVVSVLVAVPIWVAANERHGLQAAWERAQSAGRYAFTSELTQVTTPLAGLTTVGQRSTEHRLHLQGQTDLRKRSMEVTLWANNGSVAQRGTGLSLRVVDGKTSQRVGTGAWEPADDMTGGVAPQGDFMAYLRAARDVHAHAPETRGGVRYTRYTFRIDGPTFARHMAAQLEMEMRQQAALQPGAHLDLPDYFVKMTGEGELLVGEDGLPLRQTVNLHFPPQDDKQVDAHIVADFSQFGTPAATMLGLWRVEAAVRELAANPAPVVGVLVWLLCAMLVVRFRTSSVLQRAIPLLVIAAVVIGPLLTSVKTGAFFAAQSVEAAEQETAAADAERNGDLRRELTTSSWEPNADPVAAAHARAAALENMQAPQAADDFGDYVEPVLTSDNGADSDGDGLTDYTEQRLGTSSDAADDDDDGVPNGRDSDGDYVSDDREVNGFEFEGKRWYTDPLQEDTNRDGTPDGSEWFLDQEDLNGDEVPDGDGIPDNSAELDRDGDQIPDMFDDDNDGDGVVDSLDSAPNMQSNPGNADDGFFGPNKPFSLDIENLQNGKLTYVDFQLRPRNPDHLWFSRNVLDWPRDVQGQIQDGDGVTFGTDGAEAYGDMKLIPMLELKMSGTGTNLPTAAERAQYSIILNPLPDYPEAGAAGSVAYVPLSLQSDGESGAQVAFTGRMLYRPTAALGTQQVRLVWAVQMLGDVCKDVANDVCSAYDQQNQVQIVHTYEDEWALTGLTVRENHGTKLAIVNEDPAVDSDRKDDGDLALLSTVLDDAFIGGRDADDNGQRDLSVEEIARRLNRTTNGSVPSAQRWELPNVFNVAWDAQRNSYTHIDEAVISTTVTETKRVLNTQFAQAWTADRTIKPLLMYLREDRSRNHGSEMVNVQGGSASYADDRLTLNMGSGAVAMPVDTVADLKWAAYCADQTAQNQPNWDACDQTVYWEEMGRRYAQNTNQDFATDPNVVDINAGRVLSAQLYYLSLAQGISNIVQRGTTIVIPTYKFKTDNEHIQNTYDAKKWIKEEFKTAGGLVWKFYFDNPKITDPDGTKKRTASFMKLLSNKLKEGLDPFQERINAKVTNKIAATFKSKAHHTGFARAGVAIAVVSLLAVGVGLVAHFWANGSAEEQKTAQAALNKTIIGIGLIMAATTSARIVYNMAKFTFFTAVAAATFGTSAFKAGFAAFQETAAFTKQLSKGGVAGGFIGAAFETGFALGFFIFNVVSNAITAFSPAFNRGLAEVIATTVYYVAEAIIAATVVGLIIISILKVIDAILGLICALGDVQDLRKVPGMGGACFSIAGGIIKIIAKLFYSYDVMIDTDHKTAGESDLMLTGSPDVTLADPSKGYIAAQSFSVTMPVTTTIVHKDPPPENFFHILPYMYFFNQDNLRSSTFEYSLTKDKANIEASRDVMKRDWRVSEDHKFALTPMYRGQDATTAGPVSGLQMTPGLNKVAGFHLNQGYALPAYECWTIFIPTPWLVWIPTPVCYTRTFNGNNSNFVDIIKYDIFPNTLDEFMTMADKGNGGRGLAWDTQFPALHDADGDGLVSSAYGGFDNDSAWDTDSDGLSDTFEFERRTVGVPFSPAFADTDRDGLTDKQEIEFGTYPARADTDNDGIDDGAEIHHQVYEFNPTTGRYVPTNRWEGGWDVTITGIRQPNGSLASRTVRVSSDPTMRDSDGDGIPDSGERQLAQAGGANALDRNKVPYHPFVPNTNPLQISVAHSDPDGIVGPNQPFNYTTTATTDGQPFAPGVLNVTLPSELDAVARYPIDLRTSPVSVVAPVSVNPGAASGNVSIASRVNGRLQDTGGADWVWQPPVPDSKTNFATQARQTDLASANSGRADTYLLQSAIAPTSNSPTAYTQITPGDIRADAFPGGQTRIVENDSSNRRFLLGPSDPSVACNDGNDCLTVWDTFDNCATVTIDKLSIESEGDDPNGGIEPRIFFKPEGGSERLYWNFEAGLDLDAGQTFGPNAHGFPLILPYCGNAEIRVAESDGDNVDELIETTQIGSWPAVSTNQLFDSPDNAHDIRLYFTIEYKQRHIIAGAMVNPDTSVQRSQFTVSNPVVRTDELEDYAPAIASDGSSFLVAWEQRWGPSNQMAIHSQRIDAMGNKVNGARAVLPIPQSYSSRFVNTVSDIDVAWVGDRYLVAWKYPLSPNIYAAALNRNGTVIAGSEQTVAMNAAIGTPGAPSLAYNPASDQTLLVYQDAAGDIRRLLGQDGTWGTSATLATSSTLPRAAFHAPSQGWIVGWKAQDATYRYTALAANGSLMTVGNVQNTTWTPGTTSAIGSSLSCPSPHAQPQVDLRFEEIPGVTSFADTSGRNRPATPGTGAARPLAGARGAEERAAPYSDYALEFDGVDDYATVGNVARDDFSIAFWVKSNQVSGTDGGWNAGAGLVASGDYGVSLLNGKVHWGVGDPASTIRTNARIADDAWHFVVATRNGTTGALRLYVDGVVQSDQRNGSTATLASSSVRLGSLADRTNPYRGLLDHVRFYGTVLDADTVKDMFDRTTQSYCMAAAPRVDADAGDGVNNIGLSFARLELRERDKRGGGPFQSNVADLRIRVDNERPSSTIRSLSPNQYIQGTNGKPTTIIIGGDANDATSGVVKVEVSVNNGPWQAATGTATWAFPLAVTEGRYQIRTRATDAVDNVEVPASAMTVYVDATAPTASFAAQAVPALPRRTLGDQWEVALEGSITDPTLSGASAPGSGVAPATVEVLLQGQNNGPEGNDWQRAIVEGTTWRLPYRFNAGLLDPTGTFTATLRAEDVMGNQMTTSDPTFDVDVTGPQVLGSAPLGQLELITNTRTITGTATETGAAGLRDVAVAFKSIEQVVALSGTVLLLPFDERPGSLWHPDSTPNRYDARCADAANCPRAGEDGRIDQALRFSNGALAEVGSQDAFDFTAAESFSVQTWLRTASADGTRTLLSKRAADGQGYALQLRDGNATLVLNDVVVSGGADLRDDRWHHVMAVVDRTTGQATLYVDGTKQGTAAFTGSTANSAALQIGGTSAAPAQAFSGLLDEVLILERALLAEEVPTLVAAANVAWHPATLARRGTAGPETWTYKIPEGLEGAYQIDLRGVDGLGNRSQTANVWRGTIDTAVPRVRITATDTGASYVDSASNVRMHAIAFTCAAIDRSLSESTFRCPGNAIQPPTRSFERNPELEALFPDRVVRDGLTNSYTLWVPATELSATLSACDVFEHCATDNATAALDPDPDPNAPRAVVVAPTNGRYVAANGTVPVVLVATGAQPLRRVELLLDNTVAATVDFAEGEAVTITQRTIAVEVPTAGAHTLVARATDWSGATQTRLIPVRFVLDTDPPVVTIDESTLRIGDTYGPQSDVLRFHGTVSDAGGLVAVQVRVDDGFWADATFGAGTWRIALPVTDPEGKSLVVAVRAIDRAGRITSINRTIGVDLSTANPPDTTITTKPSNPSTTDLVSFRFAGTAGGADVASFACRIDDEEFTICSDPQQYAELGKGEHTFEVRAIDARGSVDPTPAAYTWTVSPIQPETFVTDGPPASGTSREATFVFNGATGAARFECSFDGSPFTPCASPQRFTNLGYGKHTFRVRAVDAAGKAGSPTDFKWTVLNAPPVAVSQELFMAEGSSLDITLVANDSDRLTYNVVTQPQHGVLSGLAPNMVYTPDPGYEGPDSFTFIANDGESISNVGTVKIIVDSTPPVSTISLTPPSPNGANGWYTTGVRVAVSATDGERGSGVSDIRCVLDPATAPASYDDLPAGCAYTGLGADVLADGKHVLYVSSRDRAGNEETPLSQHFQIDTTAPRVVCSASPNSIWPPNHKLIAIQTSVVVTDATSGPDGFTLTTVRSNESDSKLDKDDVANDVVGWSVGTADSSGQLRAERSGGGKGRVYTLTYQGKDKAGNTASCSTTVTVPHNR